jgi:hypothetical protein
VCIRSVILRLNATGYAVEIRWAASSAVGAVCLITNTSSVIPRLLVITQTATVERKPLVDTSFMLNTGLLSYPLTVAIYVTLI